MKQNNASGLPEEVAGIESSLRAAYKSQMLEIVRRHTRPPEPWTFFNERYLDFWEQYPPESCGDCIVLDPGEDDYDDLAFRAFLTGVHGYRLDDWAALLTAMESAEAYRASGLLAVARAKFSEMLVGLERWKASDEWRFYGSTDFLVFLEKREWLEQPDDEAFWGDDDDSGKSDAREEPAVAASGC